MNIAFANRLVELRKNRGFSQEELASRLGVSRQAVSKWERAESSPDTDNLICLARVYGVSLDELLLFEPQPQEPPAGNEPQPERDAFAPADPSPEEKDPGGEADKSRSEKPEPVRSPRETNAAYGAKEANPADHPEQTEQYEDDEGNQMTVFRGKEGVLIRLADTRGHSILIEEKDGKKSVHFEGFSPEELATGNGTDGFPPNHPEAEALLSRANPWEEDRWKRKSPEAGDPPKEESGNAAGTKPGGGRAWFEGSYPVLCALLYLLLGFWKHLWHPGWLIFLTIPIYYCLIGKGSFLKRVKEAWPVACVLLFFLLGCFWGLWHPGWLIFLTVPIVGSLPEKKK